MMVVVPVNPEIDKAQHVSQKFWQQWTQCGQGALGRRPQFQYHDRNDDGDDAIAECFKPSLAHRLSHCAARGDFPRDFHLITANANDFIEQVCYCTTMIWNDGQAFADLRLLLAG